MITKKNAYKHFYNAYKTNIYFTVTAGSRQWKNYSRKDHAWNVRAFNRWIKNEDAIIRASSLFSDLRDDSHTSRRKRNRDMTQQVSTASSTESPKRKRYVVPDNSSSSEYDESADDDSDRPSQSPEGETEDDDE